MRDFQTSRWLILVFSAVMMASSLASAYSQSASEPTPRDYRIGVGDVVRITVHGEPDLSIESRVEEGGIIDYPFLGVIKVNDMTVDQVEQFIGTGLHGDYLVDPDVQVSVIEYRPIYINGEVRKPGSYPFRPGLTVQKAAAVAGGFTALASRNRMYILRENSDEQYKAELDTPLLPGDTLIVKESFF